MFDTNMNLNMKSKILKNCSCVCFWSNQSFCHGFGLHIEKLLLHNFFFLKKKNCILVLGLGFWGRNGWFHCPITSVTTEMPPRTSKLSTLISFLYQTTPSGTSGDSSARQVKFISLPTCTKTSRSPRIRALDTEK